MTRFLNVSMCSTFQVRALLGHGGEMPRPHSHATLGEREALGPLVEVREGLLQVVILASSLAKKITTLMNFND